MSTLETFYTREDSVRDRFPQFSDAIQDQFAKSSKDTLFTINADDLYDVFLGGLPAHARQHYTCNCCRAFINRFGGLVTISEDGKIESALWNKKTTPDFFKPVVEALLKVIKKSRVNGVFISEERVLGTPSSNGWSHMHVELPRSKVHSSRTQTAYQVAASKKEDFRILTTGILAFPSTALDQAATMIESELLYRGERFLGNIKFVQKVQAARETAKNSSIRDNITWVAAASAPAGFCNFKGGMIGTLLEDIVNGYSVAKIAENFADKMEGYQRSTSDPSAGNIQQAERIVRELGIENSLQRRYATYEEIAEFIWQGRVIDTKVAKGGVFAGITPKQKQTAPNSSVALPSTVMTWEKFQRTVLPTADSLEVMVDNPNRLMAMVTAADPESPNILQWSNPFSWYYHGGIDGEIKRRVEAAGGKYEDNEIRVSLIWENYTDLDLHCVTPRGERISFQNKRSRCGGWLDIDMNAGMSNRSNTPVENIRWNRGTAPEGRYKFIVHNYAERGKGSTSYKVELEINGRIYTLGGSVRDRQQDVVFEFDYVKDQEPRIVGNSYTHDDAWSIPANAFTKVKGVTVSPNLWGEKKAPHIGHHVFFILDGAKDTSEGLGRGFFVETLQPELREIRKTLEAYTANTPIEGVENASASGVGYSKDSEWNLVVKVTTDNSTRVIKIDRWD